MISRSSRYHKLFSCDNEIISLALELLSLMISVDRRSSVRCELNSVKETNIKFNKITMSKYISLQ